MAIYMNNTLNDIFERRSIRLYKKEEVREEELSLLLDAAASAPSARNLQPIHVRVIKSTDTLDELNADFKRFVGENTPAYTGWQEQPFYHDAPVFIALFGENDKHFAPVDAGIMVQNIALAAKSMDLGTCIIGCLHSYLNSPEGEKWMKRFNVPENCNFVIGITVGRPDEAPDAKPREKDRIEIIGRF